MEVFSNLLAFSFWGKFANVHGMLAMFSLILFGAGIILYFASRKSESFIGWLKTSLMFLFANLVLLDIFGLTVYIPYRAEGGPRSLLKASEATAWLHSDIFEHKEFLAFAPMILILVAFIVVSILGKNFNNDRFSILRKSVIFSLILALIFVLIVAAEGVIVTKAAPVS